MTTNRPLDRRASFDDSDPMRQVPSGLTTLVSGLAEGCLVLDDAGRIVLANARAARLLGREADSLVGKSAWTTLPSSVADPIRAALQSGDPDALVHPVRLAMRRGVEAKLVALDTGVAVLLVEVGARDHTVVFDEIRDAVVLMDDTSRILDWNAGAARLFGFARAEVLGRTPELFHHAVPQSAMRAGLRRHGRWFGELGFRRRDGSEGVADAALVERRDDTGVLTGYVGVYRDATDRVRQERDQHASEDQLRHAQKMEAVGRLAGGVAHDFNNILTVITSYAELLRADHPEGDPRRRDADEILKATARAAALTRQLLAFGRRRRAAPAALNPAAVVEEMSPMLRQLAGERVEVVVEAPHDVGFVCLDQAQLEQIVMNLAVNARDAMPRGGVLCVELAAETLSEEAVATRARHAAEEDEAVTPERPGEFVIVRVADTGEGMPPEIRRRIFEPFFTTKGVGRGTGLGLATVYAAVMQAGGHLRVRSALGHGTTIEAWLPRAAAPFEQPARPDAIDQLRAGGGSETILVVEDETAVRLSVHRILERAGYQVLEARHGRDALRVWRERRGEIALVLSDVIMPEMGGLDLAAMLRAEDPSVRLLFMSGYTGTDEDETPLPASIPLLHKPFEGAELLRVVREMLDQRSEAR